MRPLHCQGEVAARHRAAEASACMPVMLMPQHAPPQGPSGVVMRQHIHRQRVLGHLVRILMKYGGPERPVHRAAAASDA